MKEIKYSSKQLEKILEEVRSCYLFFCTKEGKIYCSSAEEYLSWINNYSRYCIPEMAEEWKKNIRELIYSPLVPQPKYLDDSVVQEIIKKNNDRIIDDLYNYIDAAKIMQAYNDTKSFEEVDKVIEKQGHSGYTFSGLLNIIIHYSLMGTDFVDRYDPSRIKRDREFKDIYILLINILMIGENLIKGLFMQFLKNSNG